MPMLHLCPPQRVNGTAREGRQLRLGPVMRAGGEELGPSRVGIRLRAAVVPLPLGDLPVHAEHLDVHLKHTRQQGRDTDTGTGSCRCWLLACLTSSQPTQLAQGDDDRVSQCTDREQLKKYT